MPSDNPNYEEKRCFIRMFIDAKITIVDPSNHKTYDGETKNLSGSGIMFVTSELFQTGQELQVDLSSEQSKLPPLSALFEVKRVKPLDGGQFEVAGSINQVK